MLAEVEAAPSTARRPLDCVGWRGVNGCRPEASDPDPARALGCDQPIGMGQAGWCECDFAFRVREVGCTHESFTCSEECARSTAEEATWPQETALRAQLADTDTVVGEFLQEPDFAFEFAPEHIMEALGRNLPFAIFLLCDCNEDVRWGGAIAEMRRLPQWHEIRGQFVLGFARRTGIERFKLLINFAVDGAPALGSTMFPSGRI